MPEKVNEKTIFSLSEVAQSIQRTLTERYSTVFWVKAEMNKLNRYPQSGHCYPDLVERSQGRVVAEMRANIWKDDYGEINGRFLEVLREPLKDGITILFSAKVNYHPVYGLSLRILDIDPSYSLGELEREKQEAIRKLKTEGVFTLNKSKELALLPKRLAIISVQTSKGYADFTKVLDGNQWGYAVFHMLFPALLQGDQAVDSILFQLERIEKVKHHFDAVAIIRGGGGDIGLTCYNQIALARRVSLFPIPVLTGIGHATNETVTEMVAYQNAITPTELADFLIQRFHNFAAPLSRSADFLITAFRTLIVESGTETDQLIQRFRRASTEELSRNSFVLNRLSEGLCRSSVHTLKMATQTGVEAVRNDLRRLIQAKVSGARAELKQLFSGMKSALSVATNQKIADIQHFEKLVAVLDPVNVLRRGFSLTLSGDRIITSATGVHPGEVLTTRFRDGEATSEVIHVKIQSDHEE
jgi:exodeoxyribonuclease VII large subunit